MEMSTVSRITHKCLSAEKTSEKLKVYSGLDSSKMIGCESGDYFELKETRRRQLNGI